MSENQEPSDSLRKPVLKQPPRPWYRQGEFWLGFILYIDHLRSPAQRCSVLANDHMESQKPVIYFLSNHCSLSPFLFLLGVYIYFFIRKRWVARGLLGDFALALPGPIVWVFCY